MSGWKTKFQSSVVEEEKLDRIASNCKHGALKKKIDRTYNDEKLLDGFGPVKQIYISKTRFGPKGIDPLMITPSLLHHS